MTFPIMNLITYIKDSKFGEFDTVSGIARKAKRMESGLGKVLLMSDGELIKGHNPNLIIKSGCFNIASGDIERFYWGDGNNVFNSEPYFIKEEKVFIGGMLVDRATSKYSKHTSFANLYQKPLLTIEGLYKQNKTKINVGIINKKENVSGKIEFLERFLDKADKSGYKPKDMLAKNPKLRLGLLENHYRLNADYYAVKFR